jgi:hypothetical protein
MAIFNSLLYVYHRVNPTATGVLEVSDLTVAAYGLDQRTASNFIFSKRVETTPQM